ncbi:MAG: hypothetical protein AABZ12_07115 [Planctomycetota bacterium]
MTTRHVLGPAGLSAALFMLGCEGGVQFHYHDDDPPPHAVIVEYGHACTPACVHYWDGTRFVVVRRGHHHGPRCGHVLSDGKWTLSVSVGDDHLRVAAGHVCTPGCHEHYWDGSSVVVLRGHRHTPGCGHAFEGGRWIIVAGTPVRVQKAPAQEVRVVRIPPPPGHVNLHVYDRSGSKWIRLKAGHVHGPSCGHLLVEGHWCLR